MTRELITTIIIPDYPDKVLISKKRNPVYYVSKNSKVRGKKDIPKSYFNPDKFYFDDRGVLFNRKTGFPQLANSITAGTPRYWVVNFQDIWNQSVTRMNRAIKVDRLKDILRPYIKDLAKITEFPIKVEIFLFDTECPVDVSNKGVIYTKVIEDLLVNTNKGKFSNRKVIEDDSVEYINDTGRTKFIRIQDVKEKRMEVRIYKSDNIAE